MDPIHWSDAVSRECARLLPQARHRVDVDVFAVAEGVLPQRPLGHKAELLIESNGRRVVGENRQFDPLQVEPVLGQVNRRFPSRPPEHFSWSQDSIEGDRPLRPACLLDFLTDVQEVVRSSVERGFLAQGVVQIHPGLPRVPL